MPLRSPAAAGLILALAPVLACSAPRRVPTGAALLQDVNPDGALVVHPVYASAFEAIEAALEADDLAVARATLARLRARLDIDLLTVPTFADARTGTDEIAARTASGELPSRENVRAALQMAAGFERVIEGRTRLAAIDVAVELVRLPESETVEVALVGTSDWHEPLVLRPGVGRLEVLRTSLEPRTGLERRATQRQGLDDVVELELPARGDVRVVLDTIPVEVPAGSIATRMRVDVIFNGGTVAEDGVVYPARTVETLAARRTDLAGWVPASLVEPQELVRLVERGGAPLAPILERAVRIAPERYEETLDLLGRSVRTLPVQSFQTLVPALRWIARANEFGRDEVQWRAWLIERYEARVRAGATAVR